MRPCSTDKTVTGQQAGITEGGWEIIGQLVGENTPPERELGQGIRMDRWMERKTSRWIVSEVQEACHITPGSLCYFRWPLPFLSSSTPYVAYEGEPSTFRCVRGFWLVWSLGHPDRLKCNYANRSGVEGQRGTTLRTLFTLGVMRLKSISSPHFNRCEVDS